MVSNAAAYLTAATAFEGVRTFAAGGAELGRPARRLERAQQSLQDMRNRYARAGRERATSPAARGKRVLVAVDGSLPSSWAAETAGRLAGDLAATVELIYVRPFRVGEDLAMAQLDAGRDEAQMRGGELLLRQFQLRLPGDLESSVPQPWGDAAVEIVGVARHWGADFIVVGTGGRDRVSRSCWAARRTRSFGWHLAP